MTSKEHSAFKNLIMAANAAMLAALAGMTLGDEYTDMLRTSLQESKAALAAATIEAA